MNDTKLNTVLLPNLSDGPAAPNQDPRTLAGPVNVPTRVLVRNIGLGGNAVLAFDAAVLINPTAQEMCFVLPPGVSEPVPLAPGQILYGASPSGGTVVTVIVSDALPIA